MYYYMGSIKITSCESSFKSSARPVTVSRRLVYCGEQGDRGVEQMCVASRSWPMQRLSYSWLLVLPRQSSLPHVGCSRASMFSVCSLNAFQLIYFPIKSLIIFVFPYSAQESLHMLVPHLSDFYFSRMQPKPDVAVTKKGEIGGSLHYSCWTFRKQTKF
uniref:Uncharacterized protein n=1 Tax=Triticum urartu TaxID=4572 RepID=A0A8R7UDP1_TRIUA